MTIELNDTPHRTDLTDREIAKLVCSQMYAFAEMSDTETVRRAVKWLSESEQFWQELARIKTQMEKFGHQSKG